MNDNHKLEVQEDGKIWCHTCRDLFIDLLDHDSYLQKKDEFEAAKAKRRQERAKRVEPNGRIKALDSFVEAMDELLTTFDRDKLPPLMDIHAVDFTELERTIRENPGVLRSAVELVLNQQHMMQHALRAGEAQWLPNANLIATIYCLQEINRTQGGAADGK